MREIKPKKIFAGYYRITQNGITYHIERWEGEWRVTCESWGHPLYWKEQYSTRKEAIEAVITDLKHRELMR